MESISDFNYKINRNFISASVVYLPDYLVKEVSEWQGNDKLLGLLEYANAVFVIDSKGRDIRVEAEEIKGYIMVKEAILDDNTFLLLKKRDEFLSKTFDFIFSRYCRHLIFYLRLAKWLHDNCYKYIKDLDFRITQAFEYQLNLLTRHKEEIQKHFGEELDRLDADIKNLLNLEKSDQIQLVEDIEFVKQDIIPLEVSGSKKKNKQEKLKELKEFTKSYAEELILEKVFNVK